MITCYEGILLETSEVVSVKSVMSVLNPAKATVLIEYLHEIDQDPLFLDHDNDKKVFESLPELLKTDATSLGGSMWVQKINDPFGNSFYRTVYQNPGRRDLLWMNKNLRDVLFTKERLKLAILTCDLPKGLSRNHVLETLFLLFEENDGTRGSELDTPPKNVLTPVSPTRMPKILQQGTSEPASTVPTPLQQGKGTSEPASTVPSQLKQGKKVSSGTGQRRKVNLEGSIFGVHDTTKLVAREMTNVPIQFPQGKQHLCMPYSFANALYTSGRKEEALMLIPICKEQFTSNDFSKENQITFLCNQVAKICKGYVLKKIKNLKEYDEYDVTDLRVTLFFPFAADDFCGHAFSLWKDLVFDSCEKRALYREKRSFERCTGHYVRPLSVYVLTQKQNLQLKTKMKQHYPPRVRRKLN
jgi:hypothetical protein